MTLCQSIETLSMALLDDELVAEERRELELHVLDCASCRQRVEAERADLELIRKALVAPPAPALLKARIGRALDAEDAAAVRSERRRWASWDVATVVKRQGLPLEVQGTSTGVWLRTHFAPVEPPQFAQPGIALLGARLLPNGIANHDAALLQYLVAVGSEQLILTAVVLK